MLIEYTRNGRRRTVHTKVAKVLIARGLAREVAEVAQGGPVPPGEAGLVGESGSTSYSTRMLTADVDPAPYGYKADGTPRKRPAPVRKTAEYA